MNKFVIDAYAWIEYLNGSEIGKKVKIVIEHPQHEIFTSTITFSEIIYYLKRKDTELEEPKKIIILISTLVPISVSLAEEAGTMHAELRKERKHIGLADTFVITTARSLNAKIVTGDEDFRGLNDVIMIK